MQTATIEKVYTVLGYTEEVSSCDCCGRTDLKGTLVLQDKENGDINYFGVVCGAKIAKSTVKVLTEQLSATEKENLVKAGLEFRATPEYIESNNYMNMTDNLMDEIIRKYMNNGGSTEQERAADDAVKFEYIKERCRLGSMAAAKKNEIAAKYFIKTTHKF